MALYLVLVAKISFQNIFEQLVSLAQKNGEPQKATSCFYRQIFSVQTDFFVILEHIWHRLMFLLENLVSTAGMENRNAICCFHGWSFFCFFFFSKSFLLS